MESFYGNPAIAVDGVFVGQKWLDLAEILQDYNSQLELRWIPTNKREAQDRDKPYMVVHKDKFGRDYVVTYASELEDPAEVLTRVFNNDMKHGDVHSRLQNRNNAFKVMETYRRAEEMAEAEDMAAFMVSSNKNWVKMRNKTTGEMNKYDSNRNNLGSGKQHL